jgi:hypothetical protein
MFSSRKQGNKYVQNILLTPYNWMMVHLTMRITTKIQLMRSTLSTLWGLARLHEITAKITQSVLGVQTSNCAIMQHHFFKELHQTFTTFVGPSERIHAPMNGISLGG